MKLPDWKELTSGKKGTRLVLALGIAGMALILISEFWPGEESKAAANQTDGLNNLAYAERLEEKVQRIVSQIDGAGEVQVAITVEGSGESIYALDEGQEQQQHVLLDTAAGEQALVEETREPEIRGVAVVCQGADDIQVVAQITDTVSVLLGIPTNRISVAKMS